MRGGDRGYRGRGGEREGGQTKSSGKRGEDICTINNQIPAAALVQPLCLSLCPSLPSFFFLHPSSFPSFYPLLPESPSQSPVLHPLCFRSCPLFTFPSPPSAFTSSDASHPSSSHPPLPPRSIRPFVIVRLHHSPAGFFFFFFWIQPIALKAQQTEEEVQIGDGIQAASLLSIFAPDPTKLSDTFLTLRRNLSGLEIWPRFLMLNSKCTSSTRITPLSMMLQVQRTPAASHDHR